MKLRRMTAILMALVLIGGLCFGALAEGDDGEEQGVMQEGASDPTETTEPIQTTGDGDEIPPEEEYDPGIKLIFYYEGQENGDPLVEGVLATITAVIEDAPPQETWYLVWQNDIGGEFADVPGENETQISFYADERNASCYWRALMIAVETEADAE